MASSQTTAAYEPEGHPNPFLRLQNDDLPNFLDRFDTHRLFLCASVPRSGPVWETLNDQIVAQLTSSGLHLPPPPDSLNIHVPVPFHQLDWQLLGPTTRSRIDGKYSLRPHGLITGVSFTWQENIKLGRKTPNPTYVTRAVRYQTVIQNAVL